MLDLADKYTIYFGDWHGHYDPDDRQDMREFRQTLEDLLDNKIFDETLNRVFMT